MAAQVYSTNDLLQMRQSSTEAGFQKDLRSKLKDKVDLNDIVRNPISRRLGRIPEESRDTPVDKEMAFTHSPVRQLDGTDSEWKYRGRSDSEDAQPQPISAPPGLAAQKDEGFQRFYRAVVSPTHVRVTAGGRIVPNNRTAFTQNPRWAREKLANEPMLSHPAPIQGHAEHPAFQFPHMALGPIPQMYAGFAPGPGVTPTPPPYTLVPWHMSMGIGSSFGMPIVQGPMVGTSPARKKHRDIASSEQQSESGISERASSVVPPLDFYDPSRSILFNNQWMIPPGAPFYPVPLAPSQGFSGTPVAPPTTVSGGPNKEVASWPGTKKTGQSMENKSPQRPPLSKTGQANGTQSTLPISSIRPSDITKRHLDILRTRLRYLEDQLQFNKHQIDERLVENDAQLARQYIQQFETNFEVQLHLEETHYPKVKEAEPQLPNGTVNSKLSENQDHKSLAVANSSHGGANYGAFSQDSSRGETNPHYSGQNTSDTSVYRQAFSGKPKREKSETRFSSGINSTKSVSAFAGFQPLSEPRSNFRLDSEKSRLPLDAALAPPFQPRSDTTLQNQNRTFMGSAGGFGNPGNGLEQVDNSRISLTGERVNWDILSTPCPPHDSRMPYLAGQPPHGMGLDRAQATDTTYERELTADELRARHMYWGKVTHHLQPGLPKLNGKDLYPPSPLRDSSMDGSVSRELPMKGAKVMTNDFEEQTPAADPFKLLGQAGHLFSRDGPGNSTQSESLPGPSENSLRAVAAGVHQAYGGMKRVGASLDELAAINAFDLTKSSVGDSRERSSGDDCDEEKELIFRGRKAMQQTGKTHNKIWSSMLKKGKSSAVAVPGTVSAATAQGVLPQYAGHATASLTPTIANNGASTRANLAKPQDAFNVKTSDMVQGYRGENCPPGFSNVRQTVDN